jgi:hypothetical protein
MSQPRGIRRSAVTRAISLALEHETAAVTARMRADDPGRPVSSVV